MGVTRIRWMTGRWYTAGSTRKWRGGGGSDVSAGGSGGGGDGSGDDGGGGAVEWRS
jgi:hypothetical protein